MEPAGVKLKSPFVKLQAIHPLLPPPPSSIIIITSIDKNTPSMYSLHYNSNEISRNTQKFILFFITGIKDIIMAAHVGYKSYLYRILAAMGRVLC